MMTVSLDFAYPTTADDYRYAMLRLRRKPIMQLVLRSLQLDMNPHDTHVFMPQILLELVPPEEAPEMTRRMHQEVKKWLREIEVELRGDMVRNAEDLFRHLPRLDGDAPNDENVPPPEPGGLLPRMHVARELVEAHRAEEAARNSRREREDDDDDDDEAVNAHTRQRRRIMMRRSSD